MISFQQMCENLTQDQRYSWFLFPRKYVDCLTVGELVIVYEEPINDEVYTKFWYPKERWTNRQRGEEEIKRELLQALEDGDVEKIKQLKGMTKR